MLVGPANAPSSVTCGQLLAYSVALSVPFQRLADCGGCQRSFPTGGAAYGMPRKMLTTSFVRPWTLPSVVVMTGPSFAASAALAKHAISTEDARRLRRNEI